MVSRRIYLDHAATTPMHPEVVEAMLPYLRDQFANPLSVHSFAEGPMRAMEEARGQVAALIGAEPEEVIFTGSGTEANNFALKGMAWAHRERGNHLVVSSIEHESVLYSAKALERQGFLVTQVGVDREGCVDPEEVAAAITDQTILVSVMHANHEIGTLEPIADIARLARERGVHVHTDAVQTAGTIPVAVGELAVDLLSLAGHQFYGPKGAGALYVRRGVRIIPFLHGGIQEEGRRAGTDNVAAIVGLGKAAELAQKEVAYRAGRLAPLRDRLIEGLRQRLDRILLNGHPQRRLPGNAHFCVEGVEGESMLLLLDREGIAASSGSACATASLQSHVLKAIGLAHDLAQGSILFSLGMGNTAEEIDQVLEVFPRVVHRLRQISPCYPASTSVVPQLPH